MPKLYLLPGIMLGALLATACTTCGGDEAPRPASCQTLVTVRYPICNVAFCQQHPLLLALPDGRQLNPSGPVWEGFRSTLGPSAPQRLLIDYTLLPTQAIYTWGNADITCVSNTAQ
jgi:hypothetical protein